MWMRFWNGWTEWKGVAMRTHEKAPASAATESEGHKLSGRLKVQFSAMGAFSQPAGLAVCMDSLPAAALLASVVARGVMA